jgi:hypothetical protein
MNHFPSMMAFIGELHREKMMYAFEDINAILSVLAEQGIVEPVVEPIDDPSIQTDFYDWAAVVGLSEEIEPDVEWA